MKYYTIKIVHLGNDYAFQVKEDELNKIKIFIGECYDDKRTHFAYVASNDKEYFFSTSLIKNSIIEIFEFHSAHSPTLR